MTAITTATTTAREYATCHAATAVITEENGDTRVSHLFDNGTVLVETSRLTRRGRRTTWTVNGQPLKAAHAKAMLAGSPEVSVEYVEFLMAA